MVPDVKTQMQRVQRDAFRAWLQNLPPDSNNMAASAHSVGMYEKAFDAGWGAAVKVVREETERLICESA